MAQALAQVGQALAIAGGINNLSGLFGSSDSSAKSLANSMALQTHQYNLNRLTRKTAYQDTRYSLEQAGYNPMLAVGQQAQGGTYGAVMQSEDPKTENLRNRIESMQALSQTKLNSAQAYNQIMQGNLTTAQASNLRSQSALNNVNIKLTSLQSQAQQITNLHLPQMLKSQILLNNNMAQAQLINATANQTTAQANMISAKTNQTVGQSQAWRNYNQSLGFNTSFSGPGFSYSHTGNPMGMKNPNQNSAKPKYQTEVINGKKVQVRIF